MPASPIAPRPVDPTPYAGLRPEVVLDALDSVGLRGDGNSADRSSRLRTQGVDYARAHASRLPAVEGVRLLRTFGLWQPRRHVFFAEGRVLPAKPR